MTYLDRFRNKIGLYAEADATVTDVIAVSSSRTEVEHLRKGTTIPAVYIVKDKEGGDETIIYTYTSDSVLIGDYIKHGDRIVLVYEKMKNILQDGFIDSHKTLECNVEFLWNNNTIYAYFGGGLRAKSSDEAWLGDKLGIASEEQAIMILPASVGLTTNDRFRLSSKTWRVVQSDIITVKDIAYTLIEITQNTIDARTVAAPIEEIDSLKAGITYSFVTEGGYFTSSPTVTLIERTATLIKFKVPYNISSIDIGIKSDGLVVNTTYAVGE